MTGHPAVASRGASRVRVGRRTILALAAAEATRLARDPLLLLAAILSAVLAIAPWLDGHPHQAWSTQTYTHLAGFALPLYFAAFVVANLAATRERESTTAETFRSTPTRPAERTVALLLAGIVPVGITTAIATAQLAFIASAGGIEVGDQAAFVTVTPTLIEALLAPAITATAYTGGLAVARTVQSPAVGVVTGGAATYLLTFLYWMYGWFPGYFLAPYATALRRIDLGRDVSPTESSTWDMLHAPNAYDPNWYGITREVDRLGWHIVYLVGIATLLAAYAIRRSGRDPRAAWLLGAGLALTITGVALQLITHRGPFPWLGDIGDL